MYFFALNIVSKAGKDAEMLAVFYTEGYSLSLWHLYNSNNFLKRFIL